MKEYKVKLTSEEVSDLKTVSLLEAASTYEGAIILGVINQIINQDKITNLYVYQLQCCTH